MISRGANRELPAGTEKRRRFQKTQKAAERAEQNSEGVTTVGFILKVKLATAV
jgi:hypothetical protein